jgi:cytidyltransferase-like protein
MSAGVLFASEVDSPQSETVLLRSRAAHRTGGFSEIDQELQADPARSLLRLRWCGGPPERQAVAPIVVTGVFDILHPGHVRFLTWAAARGRPLYVGVEDDERVRHWKGPSRPVHTVAERAEVLSALKPVSKVFCILGDPIACESGDYVRLLRPLRPAALAFTAGDPHAEAKQTGAAELGADCLEFPFEVGHATSSILDHLGHEISQEGYSGVSEFAQVDADETAQGVDVHLK